MYVTWGQIVTDGRGVIYEDWQEQGFRCLVMRGGGSLCAYIGVPIDHPLAGTPYDDLMDLECHGGLTFASKGKNNGYPVGWYWFGWDYGHLGDYMTYYDDAKGKIGAELAYHAGDKKWLPHEVKAEILEVLPQFKQIADSAKPKDMSNKNKKSNQSNDTQNPQLNEYLANQKKWAENSGIKKGSRVTVMDKPSTSAFLPDIWADFMNGLVGKTGTIIYPDDINGVAVEFEDGITAFFPFFVLSVNE